MHGSKADLAVGEMLVPGRESNVEEASGEDYGYFTATLDAATFGSRARCGQGSREYLHRRAERRVRGRPSVTDKRFFGNLTQSYCPREPLRVVRRGARAMMHVVSTVTLKDEARNQWDRAMHERMRTASDMDGSARVQVLRESTSRGRGQSSALPRGVFARSTPTRRAGGDWPPARRRGCLSHGIRTSSLRAETPGSDGSLSLVLQSAHAMKSSWNGSRIHG